MRKINCPNCNAILDLSADKSHLICEYCESVFTTDSTVFQNFSLNEREVYAALICVLRQLACRDR